MFEFFRNDKLDARNFFAQRRPKNRYNNFGWTFGGPIRKEKLFFFLSNEYRPVIQSTATNTTIVPTPQQIAGDFSGVRAITDPDTGMRFPNDRIPASRLDPNALLLVKNYYPQPTPGFRQGALNFTSSAPDDTHWRSGLGRLDYLIKPNVLFFARYNIDSARVNMAFGDGTPVPYVGATIAPRIIYTSNASLNWTVSPNVLNQLTGAWMHAALAPSMTPLALRTPGFDVPRLFNAPAGYSSAIQIPSISMSQGYAGLVIDRPQNISHYTFEIIDNLSVIRGRHQFKFGGSIDKENKSQNQSNPNNNGTFTFNGSVTGDSLADMLLGKAFQYTENSDHVFGRSNWSNYGLYVQDQFRAHPRLSLTYGIRWEYFQPEHDFGGTYSFFQPSRFDRARRGGDAKRANRAGTENSATGLRSWARTLRSDTRRPQQSLGDICSARRLQLRAHQ